MKHPTSPALLRGARLWRWWVAAMILGELVGLGGVGLIGLAASMVAPEDPGFVLAAALFAAMITTGAGEGAIVGLAQSVVLRRSLPAVPRARWVAATAAGAALAWILGASVAMSLSDDADIGALISLWVGIGMAAGVLLGAAQWVVLRGVAERAWVWLPANAAGWGLGVTVAFAGASAVPGEGGVPAIALIVLTGAATGIAPAAVTGVALVRLTHLMDERRG